MKSVKLALLGNVFALAALSAASAADVYEDKSFKDEPGDYYSAPAIGWTGFYVGGSIGSTFDDVTSFEVESTTLSREELSSAVAVGMHVGYNWQASPSFVYGLEADISFLGEAEVEDSDGDTFDVDATEYLGSIRGRLGYARGSTLVYATGGFSFLEYKDDAFNPNVVKDVDTGIGYVVGAGLDHKISDNWSLGLEGLYYDVSSDAVFIALDDSEFDGEVNRDLWTVRARASYHFGGGSSAPLK
jgi:outer membrane immunogenic protein